MTVSCQGLPVLLFDGDCAVCDATVRWVLEHDPVGVVAFAPLAGETAAEVRIRHPEWPPGLDSLVLVEGRGDRERICWYSTAVLRTAVRLGGVLGGAARAALWVPRFVRDPPYRLFARVRLRIFGRLEVCRVPRPDVAHRFLP